MPKIELPKHMSQVPLASGVVASYWKLPPWARAERNGKKCPVVSTRLGPDLGEAIQHAERLNLALEGFRRGTVTTDASGSVAWLFGWYRGNERFKRLAFKTRRDYARIMDAIIAIPLKSKTVGEIEAKNIDGVRADKIIAERLKSGKREGVYTMQICRRVWNEAIRNAKQTGIRDNPFARMGMSHKAIRGNRAVTREEFDRYRVAAHELGIGSMAVAATLMFELAQRVVDVFGFVRPGDPDTAGMRWSGYAIGERIAVGQHKLGEGTADSTLPLADEVGRPLYPVLEHELGLAMMGPHADPGGYIVLHEISGARYDEEQLRRAHRMVIRAAKLPAAITPTSFRHGGATELGDAGIADIRPISRHRTLGQTATYNKVETDVKARSAAARRAAYVEGRK